MVRIQHAMAKCNAGHSRKGMQGRGYATRALQIAALCIGLFIAPGAGVAGGILTEAEIATLPEYCRVKLKSQMGSPEWERWADRIPEFNGIHHYCTGLGFLHRATTTTDPKIRGRYLHNAENEMSYHLKSPNPAGALTGTIFFNRGVVNATWGRPEYAARDYAKAIEFSPGLVQAYTRLADILVRRGDRSGALEIVTQGLRNVPTSGFLQRQYLALGGKEPFPEPVHVAVPERTHEPEDSPRPLEDSGSPEISALPEQPLDANESQQSERGMDKRSCRFCAVDELGRQSQAQGDGRSCRFCVDKE